MTVQELIDKLETLSDRSSFIVVEYNPMEGHCLALEDMKLEFLENEKVSGNIKPVLVLRPDFASRGWLERKKRKTRR